MEKEHELAKIWPYSHHVDLPVPVFSDHAIRNVLYVANFKRGTRQCLKIMWRDLK